MILILFYLVIGLVCPLVVSDLQSDSDLISDSSEPVVVRDRGKKSRNQSTQIYSINERVGGMPLAIPGPYITLGPCSPILNEP